MNKPILSTLVAAIALSATLASTATYADEGGMRHYAVTITNITRGQILAPAAVIAHNDNYKLFNLGGAASPELAMLAEEGSAAALVSMASSMPSVSRTSVGSGIIMPGASQTIEIEASGRFPEISVAAMLVSTNDGFMAVRGVIAPRRGEVIVGAEAYDAGSEANSESCAFIPGPPCGSHVHDSSPAEGYVHIHAGIHGIGGLTPAMHDWRGAVAQIEIKRIN
ncbi:hypothetical protein SCT_2706 [Sulfuricella sp. T08]|uniref:spondin domain-containing protein n=1 Tax=Sulfuricella sp. T08 TaxID=1632857 RepID=UPI0006179CF6|nr:spondin domain-containing protein [Sulfuricella sp. T08]GAO37287.1 hypothetical protein SCT_2706 [Sulfuricella sp. T08]